MRTRTAEIDETHSRWRISNATVRLILSGTLRSIATYCAAAAKVPVSQASQDVGLQDVAQVP